MKSTTISICVLFLACFSISTVMGGTPSGFIYGNPAIGVFEFVNETSGMEELLFDTSVSNPTAITVDGENDVIFFANAACVFIF